MSSANLKSEIAPKGMKFNVNDFMISDKRKISKRT